MLRLQREPRRSRVRCLETSPPAHYEHHFVDCDLILGDLVASNDYEKIVRLVGHCHPLSQR